MYYVLFSFSYRYIDRWAAVKVVDSAWENHQYCLCDGAVPLAKIWLVRDLVLTETFAFYEYTLYNSLAW